MDGFWNDVRFWTVFALLEMVVSHYPKHISGVSFRFTLIAEKMLRLSWEDRDTTIWGSTRKPILYKYEDVCWFITLIFNTSSLHCKYPGGENLGSRIFLCMMWTFPEWLMKEEKYHQCERYNSLLERQRFNCYRTIIENSDPNQQFAIGTIDKIFKVKNTTLPTYESLHQLVEDFNDFLCQLCLTFMVQLTFMLAYLLLLLQLTRLRRGNCLVVLMSFRLP